MTVRELKVRLEGMPEFMQDLPVYVQDGFDPSDACEAKEVRHVSSITSWDGKENVEIV